MKDIMVFEDIDILITVISGEPMFEVYSTGMALGQSKWNGKRTSRTPHRQRIDSTLTRAEIQPYIYNDHRYMTESQLYDFMLESRTEKVKPFKKWLTTEVLPQIRKTGGYVPVGKDDSDSEIMARAIKIADKTIKEKDRLISELQPKAIGYDEFLHTPGFISLNKTAKSIQIGRNKMIATLRSNKVLFKDGSDNLPYQRYINSGYFTVNHIIGRDGRIHSTTRVSSRGVEYIHNLLQKKEVV